MKILLQSTLFHPSVGGIETVSLSLATRYTELGHCCTVVTHSVHAEEDHFPFQVSRNPSLSQKLKLIRSHDVLHCNGASMELVFWAKLLGKPVVWTHAGYQLVSIDGLGWHEGEPSPLHPFGSFKFHNTKQGLAKASIEYAKLLVRRVAALMVDQHVAITHWVAKRQPFNNQIVIYNPFPIDRFAQAEKVVENEYDFFFVGRLVSEKGVGTLLKAFHLFVQEKPSYAKKLLVIGDGSWRSHLEKEANDLAISHRVHFVGKQTGDTLLQWVSKGNIAVIPSEWEEPMGGVGLEMLAAGKPVIVSSNGGLAECVGRAGLTFLNGDAESLKACMERLYNNPPLQEELKSFAKQQILNFNEISLTRQYIAVFEKLL